MLPETAATMMSNLLPKGVEAPGGQGFGAGGQVLVRPVFTGQGIGTFSWAGVVGTMMWVDRAYQAHAVWLAQFMPIDRSEEHTSELQSLMRISYAVFCLKK